MIKLIPLSELRPHEKIIHTHAKSLLKEIRADGVITHPILVDNKTKVILDGHHRYMVAKLLKLAKIPCIVVDYFDEQVVTMIPRRKKIVVTKEDVIQAGITGLLFPHKTTKHTLLIPCDPFPTPIVALLI